MQWRCIDDRPDETYAPAIPTRPPRGPFCAWMPRETPKSPFHPQVTPIQMPGPDQRTARNRRPRRRTPFGGGGGRLPVTEHEELQELEAARERNDVDVADLREMSVTELRQVGRELELDT